MTRFSRAWSNGHYKLLKNPLYAKLINDFFKQKFKAIEMHNIEIDLCKSLAIHFTTHFVENTDCKTCFHLHLLLN